ncbi:MAG: hypothetical protein WD118_01535 [Phycisphaeraceae bacterium]
MQHDTLTCSHCGYELTGLETQGRCPECGRYFDHTTREGVSQPPTRLDRSRLWLDKHLRTTVIGVVGGIMLVVFATLLVLASTPTARTMPLLGVLAAAWLLIVLASYFEET